MLELRDTVLSTLDAALRKYNPDQPRAPAGSESGLGGQWVANGASERPKLSEEERAALIARRKEVLAGAREILGRHEDGVLTGSDLARFMALGKERSDIDFRLAKKLNLEKLKSAAERMSTLSPETVLAAYNDTMRNRAAYDAINAAADGVQMDALTSVDKIMLDQSSAISSKEFYDNYSNTREALRSQFGDKMRLFRAEGKQRKKPTKNWATTDAFARQFGANVVSADVPVDSVVAVNVGPTGNYHELIVVDAPPKGTKAFDPDQPRDETGRWATTRYTVTVDGKTIKITDPNVPDQQMVWVDAAAVDRLHQLQDVQGHIGPNGVGGLNNRYQGVKDWLKENNHLEAPYLYLNDRGMLTFGNGRHRFAVLRDAGLTRIPVSLGEEVPGMAEKLGLKPAKEKQFGQWESKYTPDQPRDYHGRWTSGSPGVVEQLQELHARKEDEAEIKSRVLAAAEWQGFPKEDITFTDEEYQFQLNGEMHFAAGTANLKTGKIKMYMRQLTVDNCSDVAIHEIQHIRYQIVLNALRKESDAMMKDDDVWSTVSGKPPAYMAGIAADGNLRGFARDRYPIYDRLNKYSDKVAEFRRLADGSVGLGISSYASEWWKDPNAPTTSQMHESIAEIARIRSGIPSKKFEKLWDDYYKDVEWVFKKLQREGTARLIP